MKMIPSWPFLVDIYKCNAFLELQLGTSQQNSQITEEWFLYDLDVMFGKLELDGKYSPASEELKKNNFKEKM